jgi:hypothetical protein
VLIKQTCLVKPISPSIVVTAFRPPCLAKVDLIFVPSISTTRETCPKVTFNSATSKENVAEKRRRLQAELLKLSCGDIYGDEEEDFVIPETLEGVVSEAEIRELDAQVARERESGPSYQSNRP